jgi:hypothetical protein
MLVSAAIWLTVVGAWLALLALFVMGLAIASSRRKERRSGLDRRRGGTDRRAGEDRRRLAAGAPNGHDRRRTPSERRAGPPDRRTGRDRRAQHMRPVVG